MTLLGPGSASQLLTHSVDDDLWRVVSAVTHRRFHLRRGRAHSPGFDAVRAADSSGRWHVLELRGPEDGPELYWDGFASLSGALAWLESEAHASRGPAGLRVARALRHECPTCEAGRDRPCMRLSDRYTRVIYRGSGRSQDDWQRKRPHPERLARVDQVDASPVPIDPVVDAPPSRRPAKR